MIDMDEVILPIDFDIDQKNWIIDNDMHKIMLEAIGFPARYLILRLTCGTGYRACHVVSD